MSPADARSPAPPALGPILAELTAAFRVSAAFLVVPEGADSCVVAARGLEDRPEEWTLGLAHALQDTGRPVTVPDAAVAPPWNEQPLVRDAAFRLVIAVPCRSHSLAPADGVLALLGTEPGERSPEALRLLALIGDSLARWIRCTVEHGRATAEADRFRPLFERSVQPAWIYDLASLRFLQVNDAAVARYGFSREEFARLTVMDIRPSEEVPRALGMLAAARAGQAADRTGEWCHRRKDGGLVWVRKTIHRVDYEGRDAELVLAEDITELRTLWERVQRMDRLEHIGLLATGIAHDFNNILTPMLMVSDLLALSPLPPQDRRLLETVQRGARRGADLIRQILAFARGTGSGRTPLKIEPIAHDLAAMIRATFPRNIVLHHEVATVLQPVVGNAPQIHQALLNLCVNARDAMPEGGRLSLILTNRELDAASAATLPGARIGRFVRIEVSDTGVGIPPELQERIWEPFVTTKATGSGLGLATVRNIVAEHNGFIALSSDPEVGTVFHLYLPAVDAAPEASDQGGRVPVLPPQPGGRILVVDDDEAVRQLLHAGLTRLGYEVVLAQDGIDALTHLATTEPAWSLVVTDLDMPRLGGRDLVSLLRQQRPRLPVLVIAGSGAGHARPQGHPSAAALADGFLAKPFMLEELAALVGSLVRSDAGQDESGGRHPPSAG